MTELWTPAEARRTTLAQLHEMLVEQKGRQADYIVSASELAYDPEVHDALTATKEEVELTLEGVNVSSVPEAFHISDLAHADLTARLGIPARYYQRMRDEATPTLLAENANYWLARDDRRFMLRTYTVEGQPHYLRAVLSDRFARMDNEDMLAATLSGIVDAGVDPGAVQVDGDLTEKRLRVRITAPQIGVNVADLLPNYRSPFDGRPASELPMMWAGLEITNSETGRGAFSITPRVVLQVCTNGMLRREDVSRRTHLGERLEEGVVEWSHETQQRVLAVVRSKTRDAVSTFLSTDYLNRVATQMREAAGERVTQPLTTLTRAARATELTESETEKLIAAFTASGDPTTLGVGHALAAVAREVEDSDRSADLEAAFWTIVGHASFEERTLIPT